MLLLEQIFDFDFIILSLEEVGDLSIILTLFINLIVLLLVHGLAAKYGVLTNTIKLIRVSKREH